MDGLDDLLRLLSAFTAAGEGIRQKRTSSRKRASGTVPTLRTEFIDTVFTLVQANVTGVSPSLSPGDDSLATHLWGIANMMLTWAVAIDAGDGGEQECTPHYLCEVGTLRERARQVVEKIRDAPLLKRGNNITGDEVAAVLGENLKKLFQRVKQQRKNVPHEEIVTMFKNELTLIADRVFGVFPNVANRMVEHFDSADVEKVCTGPLADLLERRAMPSRAAVDATVILLRRTYQVSPDAVKEGAAKRLARRNPNRSS